MFGATEAVLVAVIVLYLYTIAKLAKAQHRSVVGWVIICLIFPGIGAAYLGNLLSQHTVKCPACGHLAKVEDCLTTEVIDMPENTKNNL